MLKNIHELSSSKFRDGILGPGGKEEFGAGLRRSDVEDSARIKHQQVSRWNHYLANDDATRYENYLGKR